MNVPLYTSGAQFSPPKISIKSQSKTVQSAGADTTQGASAPRLYVDIEKEILLAINEATSRMYAAQRTLGDTSATPEALDAAQSIKEEMQAEINRLDRARIAALAARTPAEIEAMNLAEAARVKNKESALAAAAAVSTTQAVSQQSSLAPPPTPSLAPPTIPSAPMPSVTADTSSTPQQSSLAPPPIPSPAPPPTPFLAPPVTPDTSSAMPPVTAGIASGPVVTLDQVMNIIGTMSTKLDDVISRLASLQTSADATSGLLDTLSTTTTYGGGKTRRRSRR